MPCVLSRVTVECVDKRASDTGLDMGCPQGKSVEWSDKDSLYIAKIAGYSDVSISYQYIPVTTGVT